MKAQLLFLKYFCLFNLLTITGRESSGASKLFKVEKVVFLIVAVHAYN